jgi:hypothetical protein
MLFYHVWWCSCLYKTFQVTSFFLMIYHQNFEVLTNEPFFNILYACISIPFTILLFLSSSYKN